MKCARCGHEVDASEPVCPYCSGQKEFHEKTDCCPVCGSHNVYAIRRGYDSCCGCLGFLLFDWIGLLLGLLGCGKIEMHCRDCGAVWPFRR